MFPSSPPKYATVNYLQKSDQNAPIGNEKKLPKGNKPVSQYNPWLL